MSDPQGVSGRLGVPPKQNNLQRAIDLGFDALVGAQEEQIAWLGATPSASRWELPVLGARLCVDPITRRVTTSGGAPVGPMWTILVLHYLAIAERPPSREPSVTFADLPGVRTYASVYQGRVVDRFCATAGRDEATYRAAAAPLGGRSVSAGDAAFDFAAFPRVMLRLIWHAGDEEFPPGATMLLPDNIEEFFVSEDVIVLSECLVSRLGGRPF